MVIMSFNTQSDTFVQLVEVGPRDGLQNEKILLTTSDKQWLIQHLAQAGLSHIEATSFVHPQKVPQLADAVDLMQMLSPTALTDTVTYTALVPNMKGLERAMEAGVKSIAVFTAASETFNHRNINLNIEESLIGFQQIVEKALKHKLSVRGYVSTAFVCPYEGAIQPTQVLPVVSRLLGMGITEVSIGDTIGAAVPTGVEALLTTLYQAGICSSQLALHFHDTYGTALANIVQGLNMGIRTFDSSVGGLGGCPYAPGASGNVATEDVVYLLHAMGFQTGVSLELLLPIVSWLAEKLKHPLPSRQFSLFKAALNSKAC
jgi:hydroxymethylglutaryl-CoA lyase